MKKTVFRLVLLLFGLVLGLLICEIAARVWLSRQFTAWPETTTPEISHDVNQALRQVEMMKPDPNPRIMFRLKPNLKGRFLGVGVELNDMGLRCDNLPLEKTSDTLRIISLGDSTMFGWGVERQETYMEIVRAELETAFAGRRRVELLNMAVPAYMTVQEVEVFLRDGIQFKPDVVIMQYDLNDTGIPHFLMRPSLLRLDRIYLAQVRRLMRGDYARPESMLEANEDPLIPDVYKPAQGWEALEASIGDMKTECDRVGTETYVVFPAHEIWPESDMKYDEHYDQARTVFRTAGFKIIETYGDTVWFARNHGLKSVDLAVSASDMHPNAARHRLMAVGIFRALARDLGKAMISDENVKAGEMRIRKGIMSSAGWLGFYSPDRWPDAVVRWMPDRATRVVPVQQGKAKIKFYVSDMAMKDGQLVEVSLRINGVAERRLSFSKPEHREESFDVPESLGSWARIEISVNPTFVEENGGRTLGIAVYDDQAK